MSVEHNSKIAIAAEYLFVLLPIIVLSIVNVFVNTPIKIFHNTEWSFGATVLFGQTLVKFSCGVTKSFRKIKWQYVSLILSSLIVVGIIPSSVFLILLTLHPDSGFWAYFFQFLLFAAASFCFFLVGTTGEYLLSEEHVPIRTAAAPRGDY